MLDPLEATQFSRVHDLTWRSGDHLNRILTCGRKFRYCRKGGPVPLSANLSLVMWQTCVT